MKIGMEFGIKMKTLHWKIEDRVGHLVLARPPANTMDRAFFAELAHITREVIPQAGIRALLIYGQGRHFSAGADPQELKEDIRASMDGEADAPVPSFITDNTESFRFIEALEVPTFAAIRGTCLGSALELALCCSYRICGEGTVLGFPETSFSLMPGCGGSVKLPGITGRAKAMELILGGRNFSAEEAYRWGIVQRVVDRKEVIEMAVSRAREMIADC